MSQDYTWDLIKTKIFSDKLTPCDQQQNLSKCRQL